MIDIREDLELGKDHEEPFNVPFNLYVEGSYFGDDDCLFIKQTYRQFTAQAEQECHLLVLKKSALEELFRTRNFDDIQ